MAGDRAGERAGERAGGQVDGARAVLIDIDGVLAVSWRALPGAVAAFERLQASGLPIALLTNTTSRPRAAIAGSLRAAGFRVADDDIVTAPALTAGYLAEQHPGARCLLVCSGDIRADLAGIDLVGPGEDADVVVFGGAGPEFGYQALNHVFGQLQRGAGLVAMHHNLYWRTAAGLDLDAGAFLLGLERASGVEAQVVGKPAAAFFHTALARLCVDPVDAIMVGDDIESDVLGAQRAGLTGVLVRTGKFRPEVLEHQHQPDHVLDSFADVPDLLGM